MYFHGLHDLSYGRHGANPQYLWTDAQYSQLPAHAEVQKAVAYIVRRVGKPAKQCEPIILVGHSAGGSSAILTAAELGVLGYRVDYVATLDPVSVGLVALHLALGNLLFLPRSVGSADNWRQTFDRPRGGIVVGATETLNAKGRDGKILGHVPIADDPDIADRIRRRAVRIEQNFGGGR